MTKDEIIDMLSEQRDAALSRIAELEAAQPLREEAVQVLTRHAEARKWAARVSELEAELEQSGCVMRIPLRGELLALFRKHAAPTDEQREQRALAAWHGER